MKEYDEIRKKYDQILKMAGTGRKNMPRQMVDKDDNPDKNIEG